MTKATLEPAVRALRAGDDEAALDAALSTWQTTRDVGLGDAIEALGAQALAMGAVTSPLAVPLGPGSPGVLGGPAGLGAALAGEAPRARAAAPASPAPPVRSWRRLGAVMGPFSVSSCLVRLGGRLVPLGHTRPVRMWVSR